MSRGNFFPSGFSMLFFQFGIWDTIVANSNDEAKMVELNELVLRNTESLKIFEDFLSSCSEAELSTTMAADWTVSAVLCHLVFWDQRALTILDIWENDGIEYSSIDTDVVNEVTRPMCKAIMPETAVDLFLRTAKEINIRISNQDSKWIVEAEEKGKNVHFNRANHRMVHLEEIKAVLRKV
jgi:hypothetical protein